MHFLLLKSRISSGLVRQQVLDVFQFFSKISENFIFLAPENLLLSPHEISAHSES